MKVLVIGGNGFIGSNVVKALAAEGHQARCMLRPTSNIDRLAGATYERCEGDIRDRASLEAAMAGCDAVVHLASPSAWRDINSPVLEDVVVGGTRNVLDAAKANDSEIKVLFCSTAAAINAASKPTVFDEGSDFTVTNKKLRYSHAKHHAEQMCIEAAAQGLHVVIVNPGEVYGPNDTNFITAGNLVDFAKSSPVLVCHGGTSVAHVEDVALGVVRALERGKPGERYILGGDNLTIRQLAQLCIELLGKKATIVTVPNPVLRSLTAVATFLHIPLPYEPATIPYATRYWFVDNAKAKRELGVEFRDAAQTLQPTLQWLKEAGHIPA